ncbi:MAG TPA: methyl-accepting chemotaxis protein [Jatrophihabitans sp.]|jgi:C4-dicarboxylate-specific signal transduction histidine kinase
MPERVMRIAADVSALTRSKLGEVAEVATATKMLAINASIEASHAGANGQGFAVVAKEVGAVADTVRSLSNQLDEQLAPLVDELTTLGSTLVEQVRGTRLTDLALNAVEIIDRNLYERSCDVRWWATDSAVVQACTNPNDTTVTNHAGKRLGLILSSYTVYLDLWIADTSGRVIAHGRQGKFPDVLGSNVSGQTWFRKAMGTHNGGEYAVDDVSTSRALHGATVATYATAVREDGEESGRVIGVLGIFFDFAPQAKDIVTGIRLSAEELARTRVMLIDAKHRVLASSDGRGLLNEILDLAAAGGNKAGSFTRSSGEMVGYALTPGYETYSGLGWYGVITQQPVTS